MIFFADYLDEKLHENPKEMKIILQERNLWKSGLKRFCDNKNILLKNPKCCMWHILVVQEDFLN